MSQEPHPNYSAWKLVFAIVNTPNSFPKQHNSGELLMFGYGIETASSHGSPHAYPHVCKNNQSCNTTIFTGLVC